MIHPHHQGQGQNRQGGLRDQCHSLRHSHGELGNDAEEPTLTTLLEARHCTITGAGRPIWFGGKALHRASLENIGMVTDVRVIMIFGGVGFSTDLASLGVKPLLP